ncbi:hypothetical protein [Peterkaempfera griseoplana]|uniref:hypothetical protein n=1 Tax=Peterkaempfera griseoplana TaxID=66896 RepID=UPI0006E3F5CB|nr:hypothetical protein [Peterkaempfera griseoplana]
MIAHEIFREKLTADLVRAGLPIAATFDPSLSSGIRLETVDESLPPSVFLEWRVHPQLTDHFLSLGPAELLSDPRVQAMQNTRRAMHTAVTAILEFAGYQVREAEGEQAGALVVSRADSAPR